MASSNPFDRESIEKVDELARAMAGMKKVLGDSQQSEQEKTRQQILDTLAALGKIQTGDDALLFEGEKFILPKTMEGSIPSAIQYLKDYEKSMETKFSFGKTFNYRPMDGANAFQRAMVRVFGTTGIGQVTHTMFGDYPPEYQTVQTGVTTSVQVPWGRVGFSPLNAVFTVTGQRTREFGIVFRLEVEAPRKHRAHVDAFFTVVEDELKTNSIYRGKAFSGGDEPIFLDTREIKPEDVTYGAETLVQLETNLWSLLRHSAAMKEAGLDLKRAVLLEGPYGTGKSLAGRLTAKEAVDNGWTFILCRPGKDDLFETLQTAQLYAPAAVWFEDIDVVATGKSEEYVSTLLDALDGISAKGKDVVACFTTNFVDKIQKGVLRPGRLDAIIHVGALDDEGMIRLVKSVLKENLRGDIDYDQVAEAFHGFLPAFAKEAAVRAIRYAIARGKGKPQPISTQDLVNAAHGLRPQLALMENAVEGVKRTGLDAVLSAVVRQSMDGTKFYDEDDDYVGKAVSAR